MLLHDARLKPLEYVTLHEEAALISFQKKFQIMQEMRRHLGHLRLNHISLDLCSPENIMLFLSSNPTTGYNICSTPLWKLDGSISPTHFKSKSFYWWDETYMPEAASAIMLRKENAHGISRGFMLSKEVNGFFFVYSFGLEQNHLDNETYVQEHRDAYMQVGDSVYSALRDIYQEYCPDFLVPHLTKAPPLQVIINNE